MDSHNPRLWLYIIMSIIMSPPLTPGTGAVAAPGPLYHPPPPAGSLATTRPRDNH